MSRRASSIEAAGPMILQPSDFRSWHTAIAIRDSSSTTSRRPRPLKTGPGWPPRRPPSRRRTAVEDGDGQPAAAAGRRMAMPGSRGQQVATSSGSIRPCRPGEAVAASISAGVQGAHAGTAGPGRCPWPWRRRRPFPALSSSWKSATNRLHGGRRQQEEGFDAHLAAPVTAVVSSVAIWVRSPPCHLFWARANGRGPAPPHATHRGDERPLVSARVRRDQRLDDRQGILGPVIPLRPGQ